MIMDHEQFFTAVNATVAAKKAVDDFAAVQTDGMHFCPRCGRFSMRPFANIVSHRE